MSLFTEDEYNLAEFARYNKELIKEYLLSLLSKQFISIRQCGNILSAGQMQKLLENPSSYQPGDVFITVTKQGQDFYFNDEGIKLYFKNKT